MSYLKSPLWWTGMSMSELLAVCVSGNVQLMRRSSSLFK